MFAHKIDSSASAIPASYDETAGSLMFTAPSAGKLMVINSCTDDLAMTIVGKDNTATPVSTITSNRNQAYIPGAATGTKAGWVLDGIPIIQGQRVYLRSDTGGAVSSGIVRFLLW